MGALGAAEATDELCPATMAQAHGVQTPLTDLYIIRFEHGKGSKNLPFEGGADSKRWSLVWTTDVRYEAVCDYDGEVIGRWIEAGISTCGLERKTDSSGVRLVSTSCQ